MTKGAEFLTQLLLFNALKTYTLTHQMNSNSDGALLYADGVGNLMISSTVIAEDISHKWTSIKIEFITDYANTKWTKVKVSVNDAEEKELNLTRAFAQQMTSFSHAVKRQSLSLYVIFRLTDRHLKLRA